MHLSPVVHRLPAGAVAVIGSEVNIIITGSQGHLHVKDEPGVMIGQAFRSRRSPVNQTERSHPLPVDPAGIISRIDGAVDQTARRVNRGQLHVIGASGSSGIFPGPAAAILVDHHEGLAGTGFKGLSAVPSIRVTPGFIFTGVRVCGRRIGNYHEGVGDSPGGADPAGPVNNQLGGPAAVEHH